MPSILSALVFAVQNPYSGRQNVVNSRNVIRNWLAKFIEKSYKIKRLNKKII
jgi:hypothetical protein